MGHRQQCPSGLLLQIFKRKWQPGQPVWDNWDKVLYLLFCFRIRFKNRSCGLVNGTKRDPKHSSPCKSFTVLKNQPQEQILQQETFPAAKLDVPTLTLVIRLHEGSSKCVGE